MPSPKNGLPHAPLAPSREQIVGDVTTEMEKLILSDAVFDELRKAKKAIEFLYAYLQQERRRKKRSKHFQWVLAQLLPVSPVHDTVLTALRVTLISAREAIERHELAPDIGQKSLARLVNLVKTRTEPKYWREYTAYLNKKPVAAILHEFHPQYGQLHSWDREKYFRKVYNGIQRLVGQYGGPPLPPAPPQF